MNSFIPARMTPVGRAGGRSDGSLPSPAGSAEITGRFPALNFLSVPHTGRDFILYYHFTAIKMAAYYHSIPTG